MPSLEDQNFRRTVIYIFDHSETGAVGLVINRPLNLSFEVVLKNLNIHPSEPLSKLVKVCYGGPVDHESGFLLHESLILEKDACIRVGSDICVATSREFLEKFADRSESVAGVFAIGHSSWGPGQLEEEIRRGFWLCGTARKSFVFEMPFEDRWNGAIEQMGLEVSKISPDIGHA